MTSEDEQQVVAASQLSSESITVVVFPRRLDVYQLTEPEVDALATVGYATHASFAGLAAGFAVSFVITLLTASDAMSDRVFAAFVAIALVSVVGTVYFTIRAVADWRSRGILVERIKGRTPR